jgi:hypothetical protein
VLVDDLLLEVLYILRGLQRPGRADVADRGETQRPSSSLKECIHRLYRLIVDNPDNSSFNPKPQNDQPLSGLSNQNAPTIEGKPECIEINPRGFSNSEAFVSGGSGVDQ